VCEYWLVDPSRRAITVLVRDDRGRLASESTATGDQAAPSVLLPGFAVRPADIFP
jgi:Uma2 family endonuclease